VESKTPERLAVSGFFRIVKSKNNVI
jgi:hypothetical protein